jgi:hypothetical protein
MVNKAAGAGYETSGNYPNTRIEFYNIGNIHVMRESHRNLLTLVTGNSGISSDLAFSKAVEDTQWLVLAILLSSTIIVFSYDVLYFNEISSCLQGNLRLVLKASWETANFVSKGYPVLGKITKLHHV